MPAHGGILDLLPKDWFLVLWARLQNESGMIGESCAELLGRDFWKNICLACAAWRAGCRSHGLPDMVGTIFPSDGHVDPDLFRDTRQWYHSTEFLSERCARRGGCARPRSKKLPRRYYPMPPNRVNLPGNDAFCRILAEMKDVPGFEACYKRT